MFQRIFVVALLAGLCAGLAASIVQLSWSVPLIVQAETYETAAAVPSAPAHDEAAWQPADGLERGFWTFMTNLLLGVGAGLLLAGIFSLRAAEAGWISGAIWGICGFAAFTLAPAIGLPPELPGTAAAELGARQAWWLSTVVATAAGLAIAVFAPTIALRAAGIALLLAPHIVGAPEPATHEALAPLALSHEFIAAALVSSACFWIVLGSAAGYFAGRLGLGGPAIAEPGLA